MKKVLLFSIFCFLATMLSAFAYQTIIIDWPKGTKWNVAYYESMGNESILQYVPDGQSGSYWTRSMIIHSYRNSSNTSPQLSSALTRQMFLQNPTCKYRYFKIEPTDTIAMRCTSTYNGIAGQCEIFRVTHSQEGQMSIQYIDKSKTHFRNTYPTWYRIVKGAKTYESYYMDERVMNKAESYQL